MIHFTVPGNPVGMARPRVTINGTYTPRATKEYQAAVKAAFANQHKGKPTAKPLHVFLLALFPIPKSYSKKKREAILSGKDYPAKKPDIDNISKIILDSLNGLAYEDDKQVVQLAVKKRYTEAEIGQVTIMILTTEEAKAIANRDKQQSTAPVPNGTGPEDPSAARISF